MPDETSAAQYPITPAEVESAVAHLFAQGVSINKIRDEVQGQFHIKLGREEPWRILTRIASRQQFQYVPGLEEELTSRIQREYPWLQGARVIETSSLRDVANQGAAYLLKLVQQYRQAHPRTEVYHIGYAGGRCLRLLAREFARLLSQPAPISNLPDQITFHSVVAGFGSEDTETDPNFFYPYFVTPGIHVETRHVPLYAPGLVTPEQKRLLDEFPLIRTAREKSREINCLITSAGHWKDRHSTLQTLLRPSTPTMKRLTDAGIIGDMDWQPFGPYGPIDLDALNPELQAMVLVKLKEFDEFIRRGTQILLVLGPCGSCHEPKTAILRSILGTSPPLITHLIVDSRTARGLLFHDANTAGGKSKSERGGDNDNDNDSDNDGNDDGSGA